ncbi:hypothetical protein GCM10027275_27840 [Rhabdobacter roseus]|uniref:Uncharacterized protein n=1 Tax=Rhabdobacter roseus TaxID=1655419 RepID=A0A840TT39_9BACT|nr:hypothetical protein [Rhabdobacter roseus]MBB5284732.1 hypothetical protein [Rhabdobacter roseus]
MKENLHWTQRAFDRRLSIQQNGQEVGSMYSPLFARDVEAQLHQLHVLFDVQGFLFNSVDILDLANHRRSLGKITLRYGRKAELQLPTGERYVWKRSNFLMRRWTLSRLDQPGSSEVIHYEQLRAFFTQEGSITPSDTTSPQAALLILTGLFVGQYFRKRRRRAAAA